MESKTIFQHLDLSEIKVLIELGPFLHLQCFSHASIILRNDELSILCGFFDEYKFNFWLRKYRDWSVGYFNYCLDEVKGSALGVFGATIDHDNTCC